ncbi:hypothetical protein BGY98DRAFT_939031 [Russula aff. rugulosa BPL654]|nr:hypothetical protein BGY98DRAFT_939031 [Russula aff. rugulosa BPL654]
MPRKKKSSRANAQNIQIANQRRNQTQRPQTVSPAGSRESTPLDSNLPILDSDLTDFCSRLQITPSIRQFYEDEDDTDPDLCVSDQSSDIEEESELRRFTRALQEAQVIALKEEKKNKRGKYTKRSKRTLKRREKACEEMKSKGFFPLDEFMRRKGLPVKQDKRTPELNKIIDPEESKEVSATPTPLTWDLKETYLGL